MIARFDLRGAAIVAALVAVLSAFSGDSMLAAQDNWVNKTTPAKPKSAIAALGEIDWDHWSTIEALLSQIHSKTGIPALAAACVKDGKIIDSATVGVREFGNPSPVTQNDPFHLGSVTKSMTATVIAKLVELGVLSWNTRISEVLTDVEMRDEYRDVTLEDLLHHRAGLPSYTDGPPKGGNHGRDYQGSPTEIRAAFVIDLLKLKPIGRPGERFLYSNAGYSLAGHMAERATGESWRQLVKKHVFDPTGMKTGGFGFPKYPAGHYGRGPDFKQTRPDQYPAMDFIAPAGNVHCSVQDLARYAIVHLNGLNGKDGYLRSETIKRLHTPPALDGETQYAAGWRIGKDAIGGKVHSHGGTVNSSYAEIRLFPESGAGVVILTNVGANVAEPVVNKIGQSLAARFLVPSGNEMAFSGKTSGKMQFSKKGAGFSFATGDGKSEPGRESLELTKTDASPEDDTRFWIVIKKLVQAFNDEDFDKYVSLFATKEPKIGPPRAMMFDFMTIQVMPTRGSIRAFHKMGPFFKHADSPYPIRPVTFHFENGYPGYIGLSLNKKDKIEHFSLFVKPDLCPNGVDPLCSEATIKIDESVAP